MPITTKHETKKSFFETIDWRLLEKQKSLLLNIYSNTSDTETRKRLDGIINLIDGIQDYAVDALGFNENSVFASMDNASSKTLGA